MIETLSLMACVLLPAQSADRSDWLLLPRFNPALEMVYRGSFNEQGTDGEVQFTRSYRLHTVDFVLEVNPRGAEIACLTILRQRHAQDNRIENATPSSVRMETIRVGRQGHLTFASGVSIHVPFEGPPKVELGKFVAVPRKPVGLDSRWTVEESNRPPQLWTVSGTDTVNATACVRLVGVQQSDDWDHPRADSTAWRRLDTVWIAPRLGLAYRVERVIEKRPPAQMAVTYKSVLRYELDQRTEYPRGLADDIRREITQARTLTDLAAPLLPAPTKFLSEIDALLGRISYHQRNYTAPPPYGEALLQLKRRLESARRGEAAPTPPAPNPTQSAVATLGQPAPDFVIPEFTGADLARLRRWKGKPLLMVFFNPKFATAEDVLRLGQEVQDAGRNEVAVIALAMSGDVDAVRKQRSVLHLTVPILNGTSLRQSYGVEATP